MRRCPARQTRGRRDAQRQARHPGVPRRAPPHLECPGMSEQGNVVRRSIGIVFSDGGLLALTSHLPAGGGGLDGAGGAGALCEPDRAPMTFEESLLSTEYGEDGVQRRASLELW